MQDLVIKLAADVLAIVTVAGATYGVAWLQKRLGTERLKRIQAELETKKDLAATAVQFAQQAYKDLRGEEKYQRAAAWLADRAVALGFKVTDVEMRGLIEAALKQLKLAFGEAWGQAVKPP